MPIVFDPKVKKNDLWYKEGREEGRKEGRKEGREEGRKEIQQAFVANLICNVNYSVEEIANLTLTTVEFVLKVKSNLESRAVSCSC